MSFLPSCGFLILTALVTTRAAVEDQHYPHDFNYTINHPETCTSNGTIQLLIMVHTACSHFESRLAIRQSWGSTVKRKDVRLLFLLGSSTQDLQQGIVEEDSIYGDILQEDFLDTYSNLTLKTIMMVKWVATYCPSARYVLKIDDDCFMNPDSMLAFLQQDLEELAIYGQVWKHGKPFRDKASKWYMPFDMYPDSTYPDFAPGPSYMLTQKAVPLLYTTVLTTKPVHLEDVYLNGICAKKAKIPLILNKGFYVQSSKINRVDTLRKTVLTSHEFGSNKLRVLWWLLYDGRGDQMNTILDSWGKRALKKEKLQPEGVV